ncbi:Mobile element protein [Richelia intracellularis]|nr:Mobile element protein [Richelia intracellularis]
MEKFDNGIVSVNAYGMYHNITFPLMLKVFQPEGRLKEGDKYKTKIELTSEIITDLIEENFNIELILADSLDGESSQFLRKLDESNLAYVVAIRSNNGVWLSLGQSVREKKWCKFEITFSNQKS